METATVTTCAVRGVESVPVTVECAVSGSAIPAIVIVGMRDSDAAESRLRIRSALRASGYELGNRNVAFNVAPSGVGRLGGSGFDLALAVAYLAATRQIDPSIAEGRMFVGELMLSGNVRAEGVDLYNSSRCAAGNGMELVTGAADADAQYPCEYLELASLDSLRCGEMVRRRHVWPNGKPGVPDVVQVLPSGNVMLLGSRKAALELVRSHADSLPALGPEELGDVASIYSSARADCGRIANGGRPFRAPHCSITAVGMLGGGRPVRPGEVTLAHNGVLFLEDIQEFAPTILQALRQPVAEGLVRIARAEGVYEMPARFQLVCSASPCPCGHYGDPEVECACSANRVRAYQDRLLGIAEKLGCEVLHV